MKVDPELSVGPAGAGQPHLLERILVPASILLALSFCILCGFVLNGLRQGDWEEARGSARNLVSAIQADVARNIELYDLSLQAVVDGLKLPEINELAPDIRRRVLFDRAATARFMGSITVIDETGIPVLDSRDASPPRIDYSDRDYFMVHRDHADVGLFVSSLHVNHVPEYVIGISRRLSHPDGSFAGIVVGTLKLDYFKDLFSKLDVGQHGVIALIHTNGLLLARLPYRYVDIGRNLRESKVFGLFPTAPAGWYESDFGSTGMRRLYTYRRIGELPLVLDIGLSIDEIDAGWRQEALIVVLLMLALCGASAFLTVMLRREFKRRAEAERKLASLAQTDGLTSLPNRRSFDEAIEREWRRARRSRDPLSVLNLDADHFKAYNDRHGHLAGDVLLQKLASAIAGNTRQGIDLAARYGGEEFVVLLPATGLDAAMIVAERIQQGVIGLELGHPTNSSGNVTVSIGVACSTQIECTDDEDLVRAADEALFQAKENGRNRIAVARDAGGSRPDRENADAPVGQPSRAA